MHSSSLNQFGSYVRTKWASPRRIRFWLLVLVIVYTLLGFFGLPWIIQSVAQSTVKEDFGRELRIESVQTNPYTLTLRINGVELDDTDNRQLLSWDQLFVDLAWSSITNQAWIIETIQLKQPVIQEERFVSGETRFTRLAAKDSTEETADEPAPLPALRINELQVEGGVVRFADNLPSANDDEPTQVSLALQDIGLSVEDFSLQEGMSFPVTMNAQVADGGKLEFNGSVQLLPTFTLEANASFTELALKQAEPYLQQFVNVQLDSGTVTVNGQLHTNAEQPFAFDGSVSVDSLGIREGSNSETLIGWQRLQTEQLKLDLADKQLTTAPINVEALTGRVVIFEDKSTNFGQLVVSGPESTDTEESEPANPFNITIEGIELSDSALHFADNSLPLPFATRIHTLSGDISTLSSSSAEPARVNLEGEVAEFGLAQVEGEIHAWHPMRQTSIHVIFRNLQIPEYSPYTVEFAGRKIEGGTMDLDLDYTVNENQLDGKNNLLLHDLKLGEKMESSNAMDLPLNLAIALLQDSNGVIDLTLPVSGNVDNPQFDFGKIIQQAVGNAITSVVTAPFRFLANLIGADSEDLGKVEFAAGRSELLPPQRQRIAKLREALNERPNLILELAGPFNQDFDGPILQREKAIKALQQRLTEENRENSDASLTAESNQDIVEAMFINHYSETSLTALKEYFTEEPEDSADEPSFDALAYRNQLAKQIIAAQSVSQAELQDIGNARAEAVRNALVNADDETSIATDRVRIQEPKQVDSVNGERVAMEVGVSAD
ncbi:protein of unknown function [Pseudidiomarina planktonica]|uniref:DUF748 domain-containing protein n=1 Tax=Pseudidiomarina planktonica TaxID=1323738 RepID=A0A1Y6E7S7_9GAMM|nr:DUF748 domain-containing protein [Pseudidiomarina planktonica]RUO66343.1 DUF748 domain-containing protein [Pseudidiomarina planktonica]SMQ58697.1 protein of unknown function [Pseudidiomarina planktonica]